MALMHRSQQLGALLRVMGTKCKTGQASTCWFRPPGHRAAFASGSPAQFDAVCEASLALPPTPAPP